MNEGRRKKQIYSCFDKSLYDLLTGFNITIVCNIVFIDLYLFYINLCKKLKHSWSQKVFHAVCGT